MPPEDDQLELPATPAPPEDELERERDAFLASLASGASDTIEKRVAIILNRFPETRDSDIRLQLKYWEQFEGYDGTAIYPQNLFDWARLPSLIRARARIQNDFQLFQASLEIRKRRKRLSDEEYQRALDTVQRSPVSTVAVDESGKGGPNIIVAGVWFADGGQMFSVLRKMGEWRLRASFDDELHFKDLDDSNISRFQEGVEVFLLEATTASFKAITVPKDGVRRVDEALEELTYQLLRQGAQHEHDTGRATLPRSIQLWKDRENKGSDRILLARLRDRLTQAGKVELDGQLTTDAFESIDSHESDIVQMADLFASSLNRVLNAPGGAHAKDRFAAWFLARVGMPGGPANQASLPGDLVVHLSL